MKCMEQYGQEQVKALLQQAHKWLEVVNKINNMKKSLLFGVIMAFIILAAVLLFSKGSSATSFENVNNAEKIDIYKSLTCGCCDVYSSYVDGKVSTKVNTVDIRDSNKIKEQYGVPSGLQS